MIPQANTRDFNLSKQAHQSCNLHQPKEENVGNSNTKLLLKNKNLRQETQHLNYLLPRVKTQGQYPQFSRLKLSKKNLMPKDQPNFKF